ncbi:RHS repeat-associated core domain-containing [Brachionus plicatilis]|uniref:RHS repeat-associated core domain-containing n=1 Tax=Brachionus plicatilis TaxID=10195 RepID=A0A3M7SQP3_BRAPC|nr:RHS repeat-associated core domain-containing [Brachionus plicatilis]
MENVVEEGGTEWIEVWPRAIDPNDIIGPVGFGPLKRISPSDTLSYKIRFENLMNSTAPAQYVFIKLQVNKNLDFRTFELDEFSFANKEYSVEPGNSYYQQKKDIDAFNTTSKLKDFQMVIRVQTGLDILSKSAFWKLEALDKNTGAPPTDKTIGFLPPNDNSTHIGEGYVKFKIQPSKTAPNMARIDANASIIFDINDPIITPNIFNTIDADALEIQVEIDPNSENFGTAKLIHLDVGDEADFDKLYVYVHREIFDDLNNQTISESIKLIEQSKGKSIALELDQNLNSTNSRSSQLSEKVKLKIYSTDQIGNVRKLKEIPVQLNNPVCDQSNCLNGFFSSTANCVCDLHFIGTDCAQRQNLRTLEPPIVEFFLVNQSDMDQSMNLFVNCIGIDDNANLTLLLYLSTNSSLKEKSLIIEQVELDGRKYFSLNIDLLYSEMNKNMLTVLSDLENTKTMLELICSQSSSGVLANQSIELKVVHSNKLRPHLQIDSNLKCFSADSDIIRIHYSILNQEPESNFRIYIENLNTEFKWKVDYLNNIILIEKDQDSFEGKIDLDIKMVATNNGNIFAQVDRKISVSF